ncbi:MAG: TonB-dependent receptor plug domain-containing protein [Gammaproteobacteria bacterium]
MREQPRPESWIFKLSGFIFVTLITGNIAAQDNIGDDSTVLYSAEYFAEFQPITALDMVNRIPGVNVRGNGGGGGPSNASRGGRGLGGGGGGIEILINGKRTAGKNNNTQDQLARITADQVQRIEIIRGTGGELDVRGSTQIANIVLFEEMNSASLSYELNADVYADDHSQPGGRVTYGGQTGNLDYLFNLQAEPRYDHQESYEESILGDLSPNDIVIEDRIRDQTSYTLSTNLDYQFGSNTSARFNALYSQNDNPTTVDRTTIDIRNGAFDPTYQRDLIPGEQFNWEIGTDLEHRFNNGDRFKALVIANENNTANTRERFNLLDDGSEEKTLFLDNSNVITERILRTSYTTDLFDGQNIEFGIEGAQTILDSDLLLGVSSSSGTPSDLHGGLVPVNVPNADTTVEEMRFEPFAIHNWKINSRMTLETSLLYEFSEIEQSGDFGQVRDFSFFKPKFDYRFDITPQLQLRFLVEKVVRQINFVDFVAVTDTTDEDSNTLSGNRNLRPDYWWNYNFLAEYRLPNDVGVISANAYHHRHKDFKQRIDVSTEDQLLSAVGNIGNGDMYVLDVKSDIRMRMINMPNLLITSGFSLRHSEVRDPFQDIDRSFDNFHRGSYTFGFRHDVPSWRFNYGLQWMDRFDGDQMRYDIEDVESDFREPFVTAFAQWIGFGNTTFRLDVRNLRDSTFCRERFRYVGHVRDGILEEFENRCSNTGAVYTFRVSGNF